MAKIVWLSDFDLIGSGYLNLSVPLCNGLANSGHSVFAIGLGYKRQEHWNNFSIIPAVNFGDVIAEVLNLTIKIDFDVFVCALDIPHQEKLLSTFFQSVPNRRFKYVGIMPVEAGPLCASWSMVLMAMDKTFIISEYGAEEARKAGVSTEHIQIGIDTTLWKPATIEEKTRIRKSLGIDEDTFIVLTVADNQERKNPHRLLETFADFSKGKKAKYIMVTREFNLAGARLRDYAQELGISKDVLIFERGMDFQQLWSLYAIADSFLLASKAEGLGLPILEAMACGVPVVATNCTAISELLADNRGLLVDYEYVHRDCFGNGYRYWFSKDHGVEQLNKIYTEGFDTTPALEYVRKRTWDIPVNQLNDAISKFGVNK